MQHRFIIRAGSLWRISASAAEIGRRARALWRKLPFGSAIYPIYRREILYWDARLGGRSRLGEFFGVLTLGSLCLLPAAIVIYPALLVAYALLDEFIGLAVSAPASALVVREREARAWSVLRATPFTGAQLAAGKLSGLLYQAREGVEYLVGARWVGTLLVLPLFALMLTVPHPFPFLGGPWVGPAAAGLALAYALFVYRPLLNLAFGGALGLAASTLARSSGGSMVLTVLTGGAISLFSGAFIWRWVTTFDSGWLFAESVLGGRLDRIFLWLIPMGCVTLGRLALTCVLLAVAARRIDRLPE